jgi:hypothetical protein
MGADANAGRTRIDDDGGKRVWKHRAGVKPALSVARATQTHADPPACAGGFYGKKGRTTRFRQGRKRGDRPVLLIQRYTRNSRATRKTPKQAPSGKPAAQ